MIENIVEETGRGSLQPVDMSEKLDENLSGIFHYTETGDYDQRGEQQRSTSAMSSSTGKNFLPALRGEQTLRPSTSMESVPPEVRHFFHDTLLRPSGKHRYEIPEQEHSEERWSRASPAAPRHSATGLPSTPSMASNGRITPLRKAASPCTAAVFGAPEMRRMAARESKSRGATPSLT